MTPKIQKKTIEVDVFLLIGIALFVFGSMLFISIYFYYDSYSCVLNPLDYANNNSDKYWWDNVFALKHPRYN